MQLDYTFDLAFQYVQAHVWKLGPQYSQMSTFLWLACTKCGRGEGIIVFELTSHSSNIKKLTSPPLYKFVAN